LHFFYHLNQKILDTDIVHYDGFNAASYFHHVNFTDYHLYALTEKGAVSEIISNLLQKIISDNPRNPIHAAYLEFKKEYKMKLLLALATSLILVGTAHAAAEIKEICSPKMDAAGKPVMDKNTGKQVQNCKKIKVHKKVEGDKVPEDKKKK
jgi:hypothetical protein